MIDYGELDGELRFDSLLYRAIREWPEIINCKQITYNVSLEAGFTVQGLGEIGDSIATKYIGSEEEVIMRNLHECIKICIHKSARFTTVVRVAEIRSESIKQTFEKFVAEAIKKESLDWREKDISLVDRYFAENAKSRSLKNEK